MEPQRQRANYNGNGSAYRRRWRGWYVQIADWLVAHPGGTITQCAVALGKNIGTISQIHSSDIFQEYLAQRRRAFSEQHDVAIRERMTCVAELGLDIIQEKMSSQRSQMPMSLVQETTVSVLDRLGYGKSAPVQLNVDNSRTVNVNASVLVEAREALRAAEAAKAKVVEHQPPADGRSVGVEEEPVQPPEHSAGSSTPTVQDLEDLYMGSQ